MEKKDDAFVKGNKAVTPAEAGVQKPLFLLDSGFRRNDEKGRFLTFYEVIKDRRGVIQWESISRILT